jgi:hypothetical protein
MEHFEGNERVKNKGKSDWFFILYVRSIYWEGWVLSNGESPTKKTSSITERASWFKYIEHFDIYDVRFLNFATLFKSRRSWQLSIYQYWLNDSSFLFDNFTHISIFGGIS